MKTTAVSSHGFPSDLVILEVVQSWFVRRHIGFVALVPGTGGKVALVHFGCSTLLTLKRHGENEMDSMEKSSWNASNQHFFLYVYNDLESSN